MPNAFLCRKEKKPIGAGVVRKPQNAVNVVYERSLKNFPSQTTLSCAIECMSLLSIDEKLETDCNAFAKNVESTNVADI